MRGICPTAADRPIPVASTFSTTSKFAPQRRLPKHGWDAAVRERGNQRVIPGYNQLGSHCPHPHDLQICFHGPWSQKAFVKGIGRLDSQSKVQLPRRRGSDSHLERDLEYLGIGPLSLNGIKLIDFLTL